MSDTCPPLEYLITSSDASLDSFQLSRLNHASNLRKHIRQVIEQVIQAEAEARFAAWLLRCRRDETTLAALASFAAPSSCQLTQMEIPFASPGGGAAYAKLPPHDAPLPAEPRLTNRLGIGLPVEDHFSGNRPRPASNSDRDGTPAISSQRMHPRAGGTTRNLPQHAVARTAPRAAAGRIQSLSAAQPGADEAHEILASQKCALDSFASLSSNALPFCLSHHGVSAGHSLRERQFATPPMLP